MEHIIYKITNKLNGRFYIGMHSTKNIDDGYLGSGRRIKAEVKKYGKENFVKEVLEHLPSRLALENREAEIVCEALMQNPLCLNLKDGGKGGGKFKDAEHQQKCARAGGKKSWKALQTEKAIACRVEVLRAQGHYETAQYKLNSNKARKLATEKAASLESNAKRIATFAERGHMQGEKNSQFGTCWINDGVKAIKVKKDEAEEYLLRGYSKGRKTRV